MDVFGHSFTFPTQLILAYILSPRDIGIGGHSVVLPLIFGKADTLFRVQVLLWSLT